MRALLVSYAFPPVGGAGVGRVLKLQKYLPEHGVEVSVLTVANPSVPVTDESLMADVRPDTEVLRARTFEPGYAVKRVAWQSAGVPGGPDGTSSKVPGGPDGTSSEVPGGPKKRLLQWAIGLGKQMLVPDPQLLWQPAAQLALARRLAAGARPDVVFISGPPFSQFLLAPLARAWPGVAVILDYRDEWVTYRTTYEMMGGLGARVGEPMERGLLRCAHAVTAATDAFRDNLLASFPFLDPDTVHTLPNGYDPDDFPSELPAPTGDQLTITYAGTVFRLTSVRGLLEAVKLLHQRSPALARRLRLEFIGRIVDTEADAFAGTESLGVVRHGYLEKRAVTEALARSHMTLCVLDDVPGNERIYPGKVFELMYLGRPCLTLAPPGALAELAARHRLGPVLPPRDAEAICAHLTAVLGDFVAGDFDVRARAVDIERYHRRAQAGELAHIFARAAARA